MNTIYVKDEFKCECGENEFVHTDPNPEEFEGWECRVCGKTWYNNIDLNKIIDN